MPEPEQPVTEERKKRTIWLLAGGAVSLLIPLAGALYLHMRENVTTPAGPSGRNDLFERREGADQKITPTQTVVPPSALSPIPTMARPGMVTGVAEKPAGSSLDFIKTNEDLKARMAETKPATPPTAAPAPAPTPQPAPEVSASTGTAKASKPGKKSFSMPKLQPTRGFSSNFGPGGRAKSKASDKGAGAGEQISPDMLKNLPPGAENDPRVQAYLKSHQGQ